MMSATNKVLKHAGLLTFYAEYQSLLCFAIVGCINTGVDFAVFSLLKSIFGVNYLVCQVAGYSMGLINSFVMNKVWTFENRRSQIRTYTQFIKFVGINIFSLGVSLVAEVQP